MEYREKQLEQMGFKRNDDQRCYALFRHNQTWYVDFWRIEVHNNDEWENFVKWLELDIRVAKVEHKESFLKSGGYKYLYKKIRDKYNTLNSELAGCKHQKLTKTINHDRIAELEAQVKILKELL